MKKRMILCLMLVVMLLLPGAAALAEEKITLTYTGWGSNNERKVTQAAIDSFMAAHPNITVKYIHIPNDYNTKLTTMAAANQTPDCALFNGDMALKWAEEGKIVNVMDYVNADPDFPADGILPQAYYWWDEGKCAGFNGAIEAFALYYNKDMFEEAGVAAPPTKAEDAWTWDEFVDAAKQLTLDTKGRNAKDPDFDPNNIRQFGVQFGTWAYMQMVFGNGGDMISADGTAFTLNNPEATEAIQKISDLMNVHHVMPTPIQSKNLPNMATSLLSKKVAMAYEGQWALLDLDAAKVNFGIGVAPKTGENFATMTLGEPLVIFTASKHPKEAYELIKWFWNPENTLELQTSGLWMPILKDWYTKPELVAKWAEGNSAHPEGYKEAVMQAAMNHGKPNTSYYVKNLSKINSIIGPALDKVWLGEVTAQAAMDSIKDQVTEQLQGRFARPE